MKVLYVASNPDAGTTLRLEQEITELRRNALATSGEPVEFVFLPSLPFEDLPSQISKHKPDIVHISAHGDEGSLAMAREDQRLVPLTAEMLCVFPGKRVSQPSAVGA